MPYGKPISLQLADNELAPDVCSDTADDVHDTLPGTDLCVNPGIVAGPVHPDAGALIHLKSLIRRRE